MVPKVAGSKSSRFAEIRGSVAEASRAFSRRRGSVAEASRSVAERRGVKLIIHLGCWSTEINQMAKKSALSHVEIPLMEHFPEQNTQKQQNDKYQGI